METKIEHSYFPRDVTFLESFIKNESVVSNVKIAAVFTLSLVQNCL